MITQRARRAILVTSLLLTAGSALGQSPATTKDRAASSATAQSDPRTTDLASAIDFQDALRRARANSARFRSAMTDTQLAREDRVQARAALLPAISSTTSYVYTEGNGTSSGVFIANNGVHEYIAQANAHEEIGLAKVAGYSRTEAALAMARAREEIAVRGLRLTVTQDYYGLIAANRKISNAQAAAEEAQRFLELSQKLERGGESAHSDVIKAQLQLNDRRHSLREARLEAGKAKLALSVLLFPDFTQDFTVLDDMQNAPPLPTFSQAEHLAGQNNPEVRAAMASLLVANDDVAVARSGHLPTLSLDYWYGIDAPQMALRSDGVQNLGYAAQATLNLPIFDWGSVRSRVKQAELRKTLARVELSEAQRSALANLRNFWSEAETAQAQLSLSQNSVLLAAESLRLTNLRYGAGEASALEVVDAQNSLAQARGASDEAEARFRIALANLQTLTGAF